MKKRRRSSGKDEADKDEQGAKKVQRACINACISQSLVISAALHAPANRRPGSLEESRGDNFTANIDRDVFVG